MRYLLDEYEKTGKVSSPKQAEKRKTILDSIDEFDREAIRRKIHEFFFKNEIPTVEKVLRVINDDEDLPNFKRTTFLKLLKKINFKFERRQRNSILIDRDEIVVWRREFLIKIKSFRNDGRKIYYLDETWINAGHAPSKVWVDKSVSTSREAFLKGLSTGLKNPSGKRIVELYIFIIVA